MWRKLIKPELSRIYAVAKEAGLLVFHHTCGHIMEIVPDLIELGVDVLDSVQAHANDQAQLKHLYGSDLSFMGGVDTQYVLSQGTPEEVEAEVKRCVRCLGSGGGYILGPDNLIPITEVNCRVYLSAGERYSRYPLEI
jgi:uroporphyrinogen decarboxylase